MSDYSRSSISSHSVIFVLPRGFFQITQQTRDTQFGHTGCMLCMIDLKSLTTSHIPTTPTNCYLNKIQNMSHIPIT